MDDDDDDDDDDDAKRLSLLKKAFERACASSRPIPTPEDETDVAAVKRKRRRRRRRGVSGRFIAEREKELARKSVEALGDVKDFGEECPF